MEPQDTPDTLPSADLAEQADALIGFGAKLLSRIDMLADLLLRPWNAYQLALAATLFALAHLMCMVFAPRLHDWLRQREHWPKWRLRFALVIHRRLRLIFFTLLLWITWAVMQETTWPSHSYIIGIFARLALAWLGIALMTRLIANPSLRQMIRYGAWGWVTFWILGLEAAAIRALDSIALDIGTLRISAWMVIQAVLIVGILFALARFLSRTTAARLTRSETVSPSMRVLTVKMVQLIAYGVAFVVGLKAVGVDLTGLAVLSGAIGVGLGFGLQKVVSNLVSGVILLLDKSIKPGDVISLGDTFGWINALGARYVSITTRDGKEYLIPNEDLITGQVVNWSHSNDFVRLDIYFGTAYGDDPHTVRRIAVEAATGVDRVLRSRPPVCHIVGFGDSSVDYILRFWIRDPTGGLTNIRGNVYLALWDAFREHGISIPFPQREVRMLAPSPETPAPSYAD